MLLQYIINYLSSQSGGLNILKLNVQTHGQTHSFAWITSNECVVPILCTFSSLLLRHSYPCGPLKIGCWTWPAPPMALHLTQSESQGPCMLPRSSWSQTSSFPPFCPCSSPASHAMLLFKDLNLLVPLLESFLTKHTFMWLLFCLFQVFTR